MARGRSERRHPVPVAFFAVLLYFWGFLLLFWRPCYLFWRPVAFFLNPVTIFAVLLNRKGQKPNWEGKTPTGRAKGELGGSETNRAPRMLTGRPGVQQDSAIQSLHPRFPLFPGFVFSSSRSYSLSCAWRRYGKRISRLRESRRPALSGPCATHIETRLGLRTTKHCRGCGLRGTAIDHSFRIHRQRTR